MNQFLNGLPIIAAVFLLGCSDDDSAEPSGTRTGISAEEVQAIARDAYVYGFPMVMNLKTIYDYTVDVDSPNYKGPLNEVSCVGRLFTPTDTAVITPNADTPYCMFWMDLRSEPLVLTVPEMEDDRYYSVQLIDFYTHNFPYIVTRINSNAAGSYLLTGPDWTGEKPEGITGVLTSETDLVKDRKFYRVGEVWGTESERELTRRCSIERIVRAPGGVVV